MGRPIIDNHELCWESWEHVVKSKLENLEYLLCNIRTELSLEGMKYEDSVVWVDNKLRETQLKAREEWERQKEESRRSVLNMKQRERRARAKRQQEENKTG